MRVRKPHLGASSKIGEDVPAHAIIRGLREDTWLRATRATLALLNELLIAHGSAERAHALYYGNDLTIVFATPEMARISAAPSSCGQGTAGSTSAVLHTRPRTASRSVG